jgi:hypothetical protein
MNTLGITVLLAESTYAVALHGAEAPTRNIDLQSINALIEHWTLCVDEKRGATTDDSACEKLKIDMAEAQIRMSDINTLIVDSSIGRDWDFSIITSLEAELHHLFLNPFLKKYLNLRIEQCAQRVAEIGVTAVTTNLSCRQFSKYYPILIHYRTFIAPQLDYETCTRDPDTALLCGIDEELFSNLSRLEALADLSLY